MTVRLICGEELQILINEAIERELEGHICLLDDIREDGSCGVCQ